MLETLTRARYNAHGLKALTKAVVDPPAHMAVGGDDEMSDVPLVIYRGQSLPSPAPVVEHIYNMPYEKTAKKGANDTLTMANFETNAFDLGNEFDGPY